MMKKTIDSNIDLLRKLKLRNMFLNSKFAVLNFVSFFFAIFE